MSSHTPGPHELGQNFITHRVTIERIVDLTARTDGPIVEWGTGGGSLTIPLARLGRPIVGIELDPSPGVNRRQQPAVPPDHTHPPAPVRLHRLA